MDVPLTYASQILGSLVHAGLAASRAGKDGGYRLARAPEEISVLEVVEAGEGALTPQHCSLGDGPCRWEHRCPLHEIWSAATGAIRTELATTTLAALLERDRELERGTITEAAEHRHAPASLVVEDSVQIERSIDAVALALGQDSWIAGRALEAFGDVDAFGTGLDPQSPDWTDGCVLAMHPVSGDGDGAGDGSVTLDLAWEQFLPGGDASRLEATFSLSALDPERTELHLFGRFRLPPATAGWKDEPDFARRLADTTVRRFLRRIAAAAERSDEPAAVSNSG